MPPAKSENEPLYPEPALGYLTTTWPSAHPNLKALSPASLAQEKTGTHHTLLQAAPSAPGQRQ